MTSGADDEYFAVIPESVLYADVSAQAVRLYAVLDRFADQHRRCFPGRRRLADLHRSSPATVDRAAAELVVAGLVTITPRFTPDGDRSSNLYELKASSPAVGVSSRAVHPSSPAADPLITGDETPSSPVMREPESVDPEPVEENTLAAEATPLLPVGFDAFWATYPRRVSKPDARRAWAKALRNGTSDFTILDGAKRWASHWEHERTDPQFIPYPSTWLNGQRWNDACPAASKTRADKGNEDTSTVAAMFATEPERKAIGQ